MAAQPVSNVTTVSEVGFNVTAYNLAADYALFPNLLFDSVADVSPQNVDHPGTTITLRFMSELAVATTPLTETADIDPVDMASSTTTVTLAEYGNAVKMTMVLMATGYIVPFDPIAAALIGRNAGLTLDTLARTPLEGGTNVRYGNGTLGGVGRGWVGTTSASNMGGGNARFLAAKLRAAYVEPIFGARYLGFIHPDISYDFQNDTGASAWFNAYQGSPTLDPIQSGTIGDFAGIRWVETGTAPVYVDQSNGAGSTTGNINVYSTIVVGKQAIVKAYAQNKVGPRPGVVQGPVTDVLRRFVPIGWYWFGGFARYREASIYRNEVSSTIANNTGAG